MNVTHVGQVEKVDLHPDKSSYKNYSFSSHVRVGDLIFINFQAGDPDADLVTQTEQCFDHLRQTLAAAGATLDDVVKITLLFKQGVDFKQMDAVYQRQFTHGYPARITILVPGFLDAGALIQLDAIACKPESAEWSRDSLNNRGAL